MATPTFVKCSTMSGSPLEAAARFEEHVCGAWHCTLKQAALLRPSGETYDGGLEMAGDLVPISTLDQLPKLIDDEAPFALSYLAHDVRATFAVYFFDRTSKGFNVSISVESSLIWYRNSEFTPGRWFEGFLLGVANALRPDVIGYGRDRALEMKHERLDTDLVVRRLRAGELLSLPCPVFYAISTRLVGVDEVAQIRQRHSGSPRMEYKLAPGYHLLMDIAQPK